MHWRRGEGQGANLSKTTSKQMPERQEGQEQASNKPLPEAGQVVDHRDHLLSQWVAPKTELPCKTEKQTLKHHNTLTAEVADGTLTLPQGKGVGQRNQPPAQKSQ
jgi:hypothetical protein